MAPGGVPAPPEARGRGPPSSSSSLTSSLDGRRVSPLVFGLHGVGGERAPPRLDLSLSVSAFSDSTPSPFLLYSEIRNSDWGESFAQIFLIKLAFLRQKKRVNRHMGCPGESRACPPASWPPRASSRLDFSSQKSYIFQKKSPSVFILFGLRLIWIFCETKNMQQTGIGTGHWINMLVPKTV